MFTMDSLVFLAIAVAILFAAVQRGGDGARTMSEKTHRAICGAAIAAGVLVRLARLTSLPAGISAEEALVGVQAKALWQTGGFLFGQGLTTQLSQWAGETTGPLLAVLTAPFVGLFGMSKLTVRLPLALLSCAAMPAAYGLGEALSGRRAARWMLLIAALCPIFVLEARMTCGSCAALYLLPIALCLIARGVTKPAALYPGMIVLALMAYAQDMYFFIAPAAILACAIIALIFGRRKRHAVLSGTIGLLLCVPAMLTAFVNLTGAEGMTLLGLIRIPRLEGFEKAFMAENWSVGDKLWAVLIGGVFQVLRHENIHQAMYTPDGMLALFMFSLPLMALGALALFARWTDGRRAAREKAAARAMAAATCAVTLAALVMFGSVGTLNTNGTTGLFDHSALILFDAVMMTAGLCTIERKNLQCAAAMVALMAVNFAWLAVQLFGGSYQANANVYFPGFEQMAARAAEIQAETGEKINVTGNIYPHIQPSDGAEMMFLYATDADMRTAEAERGTRYETIYVSDDMQPEADQIYLARADEISNWDLEGFDYEESEGYALIYPAR